MPPTLFGLVLVVFAISHVVPSDPARVMAGENAPPEQVAALRHQYGLDLPLPWQFVHYVRDVATGNMGTSLFTQRPVAEDLLERLPATFELALYAITLAIAIGVPLGVVAALSRNSLLDHVVRIVTISGLADGGVLAGDPAATAVLDVARAHAGAGPHRWLGSRSDHRLLHAGRAAARRLGDAWARHCAISRCPWRRWRCRRWRRSFGSPAPAC